jgi:peptidyl-prolyl cis-trans isomerase C
MTFRVRLAGAAAAVAVVLAAAASGCQKSREGEREGPSSGAGGKSSLVPQSNEDLAATLAKVDDSVITVKQLQESINRQSPYIRARYASREQKRVFLDNMIRFEVLAREASRRGLDRDPEVVQTMKSAMITKLLKAELAAGIKPDDIPEPELRAFFDANRARFNKPEEVRVSAVVVKKKPQAEEVARLARAPEGQSNKGFRDLVAKHTVDEESKLRGGDLRYFTRDEKGVPKPVVDAAFGLAKTGDVAGPIEANKMFYVIKQTGRRAAMNRTFDQVRREIQNELYKEKREGAQKQFVDQLKGKAKIQVFDDNLKSVRVDTSNRATVDLGGEPGAGHGTADLPASGKGAQTGAQPGGSAPAGGKP